ncbi:uncharacterized protein BJ212DRAFT_1579052 [Suillus subaureus]|uniref:Uncharacterized protein n=1 Tax=Suillus subaureus TaxID=48587 RepID=A0A9P7AJI3_9AGAM|nr:uncharacterized protein BJ212DRAFT_1491135 [Suillus subaureus]XP_041184829.1 uncharacterized protein BJ212DRAFT_1583350 [Suillus subaureus]XP_041190305.1 uncharacterized protein BJ212DRAFT_1579052 [Suillus subaureus]KAG1790732.1 hypothetical protein BJ212DRAFT_1491135 [Suillus subaureus]KAG1791609.1 hypothetical protein BJ212DRAFT_1583350 [Suillus subaureus]KAG1811884.1 hypothetical protein BJ212DRAFT_1579052 [Suillus subaureus]
MSTRFSSSFLYILLALTAFVATSCAFTTFNYNYYPRGETATVQNTIAEVARETPAV